MPIESPSAGTWSRRPSNRAWLLARVDGSSRTRWVRAAERGRRLVEADVPVAADAEDDQVQTAGAGDRTLVAHAFGVKSAASPPGTRCASARMLTWANSSRCM